MKTTLRSWSMFAVVAVALLASPLGFAAPVDPSSPDYQFPHHTYRVGETFDYFYEGSEATYATAPAGGGKVPRITNLLKIDEVAVRVHTSIFNDNGKLKKRVELRNLRIRTVTAADLQSGRADVPFQPIQVSVPSFPENFSYSYDAGKDSEAATQFNVIFQAYPSPAFNRLIDIQSFLGTADGIPTASHVGVVTVTPAVDVQLSGATFHNHTSIRTFSRVDWIDGIPQAYFKTQNLGNFFQLFGVETNYVLTFHVPLRGFAQGLVRSGELQELIFIGGANNTPVNAIQRQVSMTMQTLLNHSAIDTRGTH